MKTSPRPARTNPIATLLWRVDLITLIICLPGCGASHLAPSRFTAHQPSDQALKPPERVKLSVAQILNERNHEEHQDVSHLWVSVKRQLFEQQGAYGEQHAEANRDQKKDHQR